MLLEKPPTPFMTAVIGESGGFFHFKPALTHRHCSSYVLILMEGKELKKDEEVTITYGDEKGACEMLFSYGFIDEFMESAETLFLSLAIPEDDNQKKAKMSFAQCAPGFKIIDTSGGRAEVAVGSDGADSSNPGDETTHANDSFDWTGDFIWLLCVGHDDGLEFRLAVTIDGQDEEVEALFNGQVVKSAINLKHLLEGSPLWHVYRLRAVVILQQRVYDQMQVLHSTQEHMESVPHNDGVAVREQQYQLAMQLRRLEFELMSKAYEGLEAQVSRPILALPASAVGYLNRTSLTLIYAVQHTC